MKVIWSPTLGVGLLTVLVSRQVGHRTSPCLWLFRRGRNSSRAAAASHDSRSWRCRIENAVRVGWLVAGSLEMRANPTSGAPSKVPQSRPRLLSPRDDNRRGAAVQRAGWRRSRDCLKRRSFPTPSQQAFGILVIAHSAMMLFARITSPQRRASSLMKASVSAGVLPSGSTLSARKRCCTSGILSTSMVALAI